MRDLIAAVTFLIPTFVGPVKEIRWTEDAWNVTLKPVLESLVPAQAASQLSGPSGILDIVCAFRQLFQGSEDWICSQYTQSGSP